MVPCKGLSKGNVVDVEKTSEGISQSISILRQYYNLNIKSAFLGITGSHVNFEDRWDKLDSVAKSGVITREDIIKNPLKASDQNIDNKSILHTIPDPKASLIWHPNSAPQVTTLHPEGKGP